ncbi:MAG TPA: MTH938/NDUFAF3 family protein [Dokdonella sp.]|uniref:Mth938-like domain-containing protein n=1 Tax=Dokdonella sp. TaxID=2291710 RepID=UPI0025BCDE88|nr:MTH938/NDUFAF3 family protein [Dokdonella sp.]MBX3692749.1 hypothetical protein [Dokdonella sp.]MCW5568376.1 hypothetical protein [Dokdonella sp.]HNR91485.1 MTH938/NDUFAF3 family protein [Dokdonella sp.]
MHLSHDRPEGYFFIRACRADAITVIDRELRASFVIAPDRVIEDWPVPSLAALDPAAIARLFDLEPELVILGSGARLVFPPRELLLPLQRRQVGVEVMDNSAASRTYNLLAAEGRRVVGAFILG